MVAPPVDFELVAQYQCQIFPIYNLFDPSIAGRARPSGTPDFAERHSSRALSYINSLGSSHTTMKKLEIDLRKAHMLYGM
jgi:hypothetical protein